MWLPGRTVARRRRWALRARRLVPRVRGRHLTGVESLRRLLRQLTARRVKRRAAAESSSQRSRGFPRPGTAAAAAVEATLGPMRKRTAMGGRASRDLLLRLQRLADLSRPQYRPSPRSWSVRRPPRLGWVAWVLRRRRRRADGVRCPARLTMWRLLRGTAPRHRALRRAVGMRNGASTSWQRAAVLWSI